MTAGLVALTRPVAGEYDPASAGYISRAPDITDAVREFESQRDGMLRMLSPLSDALVAFRYAAGKWSVREVVGHLSDAERILSYRLLRIARGDQTPLPGFDEDPYVAAAAFEGRPFASVLDEWTAVRNATIGLLGGLPTAAWTRRGVANGKSVTAAALVYIMLGHVEHHRVILEERYGIRN
jgi:hypothetical protein